MLWEKPVNAYMRAFGVFPIAGPIGASARLVDSQDRSAGKLTVLESILMQLYIILLQEAIHAL